MNVLMQALYPSTIQAVHLHTLLVANDSGSGYVISGLSIKDFIPISPNFNLFAPLAPSIKLVYASGLAAAILIGFWGILLGFTKIGTAGKSNTRFEGAVASMRSGSIGAIGALVLGPLFVMAYAFAALFASFIK